MSDSLNTFDDFSDIDRVLGSGTWPPLMLKLDDVSYPPSSSVGSIRQFVDWNRAADVGIRFDTTVGPVILRV